MKTASTCLSLSPSEPSSVSDISLPLLDPVTAGPSGLVPVQGGVGQGGGQPSPTSFPAILGRFERSTLFGYSLDRSGLPDCFRCPLFRPWPLPLNLTCSAGIDQHTGYDSTGTPVILGAHRCVGPHPEGESIHDLVQLVAELRSTSW